MMRVKKHRLLGGPIRDKLAHFAVAKNHHLAPDMLIEAMNEGHKGKLTPPKATVIVGSWLAQSYSWRMALLLDPMATE